MNINRTESAQKSALRNGGAAGIVDAIHDRRRRRESSRGGIFLVFVASVTFVAFVSVAHAEEPMPLSPAVASILERASKDIEEAERSNIIATFVDRANDEWTEDALSTVHMLINTLQDVILQRESLLSETACFRYDKKVLEWKMDDVRKRIDKAVKDKSVSLILQLEQVYIFLAAKWNALEHGGLDPGVRDRNDLLSSSFFTRKEEPVAKEDLCFYNSDYAPPSTRGFGCDAQTLQWIIDQLPPDTDSFRESTEAEHAAEMAAERIILGQRGAEDEFRRILDHVDVLIDGKASENDATDEEAMSSLPAREHKTQRGCVDAADPGVILHPLRNPFEITANDGRLTEDFRKFRSKQDEGRPIFELYAPTTNTESSNIFTYELSALIRQFTSEQSVAESIIFAAGADPILAGEDAFSDLRASVKTLIHLGNSLNGGLRGFVRDFAYFLRRSCLDRPCGIRLDRILKLVFTDSCFVYGNGKYLNATPENPQWKQCLCEAIPESQECAE